MKIVIIGGGIAGITLAYLLRNHDVTVIEKDFVGSGETGYSTGVFPIEEGIEVTDDGAHLHSSQKSKTFQEANQPLEFYRAVEEFTLNYFKPVIFDHRDLLNGSSGKSVYVDGYNFCYYTSIVLEKNGMNFEVMNEALKLIEENGRVVKVVSKRGEFAGDVFIVAAGASTPFITRADGTRFSWIRSLLLKPHRPFEPLVLYDEDFTIKPEGENRIIIRENRGIEVNLNGDITNKTRGVDEGFYEKVFEYLERRESSFLDSDVERGWATICTETTEPVKRLKYNLYAFFGFGCRGFGLIPMLAKNLKEEIENDRR